MPPLEQETAAESADNIAAAVAAAIDNAEDLLEDDTPAAEEEAPAADDDASQTIEKEEEVAPGDEKEEPAAEGEEQEQQEAEAEEVAEGIEYPEQWDQSYKEEFEELPQTMQSFLIDRHKSMEADYTKKNMEIADLRRDYGEVDQVLNAFTPMLQSQNMSKGELIRRWAQTESYLNTQPELVIKQLAEYYNVDLATLPYVQPGQHQQGNNEYQDGYVDPQVQALTTTVHNLETQNNLNLLNSIAEEVDAEGNKVRPYFDDVLPDMMQDYQILKAAGQQPDVKDLYEQACWKNTSVREKMLASKNTGNGGDSKAASQDAAKAAAEKKAAEARQKAAQAKKASKSVSGQSGSSVEPKKEYDTVEDAVRAAFDN